jgi:ribosome biogenesis GTPase / thiamine phosphate phosphatase
MMNAVTELRGLIIRSQSGFYTVETSQGIYTCQLRGRLKHGPRLGDVAAVGDWVRFTSLSTSSNAMPPSGGGTGSGVIEHIEPRQRAIVRMAPTPHGVYQQIIIANPDQTVFAFACSHPTPRFGMLDRFLVIAEKQQTPALIVANKVDLTTLEGARQMFDHYISLGYPVIYTSTRLNMGIDDLHERLKGKITVFIGPSGVGKSSLLNAIQPGLGLAAKEVSRATRKGRHTTVVRQLFALKGGGYVADTPGLKALALWDIEPEELDGYFPELRDLVAECQFNNCTHSHEPGCAVRAAVESGKVHPDRYRSYINIRAGQEPE